KYTVLFASAVLTLVGCIKNDIPYPKIAQNITSISANGEIKDAVIDSMAFDVSIWLDEVVDLEKVTFSEFTYTPGAECDVNLLEGGYNLSVPLTVSLTKYQTYNWTIYGYQTIERYFTVEGQIGETVIDPIGHRVIVSMPAGTDLSDLTLQSVKLGPREITTMVPDIKPGSLDLTYPLRVEVTAHGRTEIWTIYAVVTELVVSTSSADAWSEVVWAYGTCPSDLTGGFEYKEGDSEEWIPVPQERVIQDQGSFSASIPHLKPLTEYSVRAVAGEDKGNIVKVTTQGTADIPNGDFENWWYDANRKIWFPFAEGGEQYWDTGNTGTASLGQNNVSPTDYTPTGQGKAAMLDTRFVGFLGLGKLAAGSVYTGTFARIDGTNGVLEFGRPFNLRPTSLKGYYQYKTAPIDYVSTEFEALKGKPDTCHIYIALADWTAPFEIRTNPKNRQLFDKDSPSIIAYGELLYSGTMEKYKEFEIKLNYRDTSRMPTYVQITCATSKYGDYFTGGTGATLFIDQLSYGWDLP
ncbi:MAG: PCMD domain-containing protein, partial [Muribaculaceae bacterium]|nr:PCMD domain-containing protein [Muribaculaceae bacterium]